MNRLQEAIELYKDICHEKWLKGIPIIVFLNKSDIFRKKISKVDLKGSVMVGRS